MQVYNVKIVDSPDQLDKAEKLYLEQFRDGVPGYEPRTSAQLVYIKDKGLLCRMESEETNLRAEVTSFFPGPASNSEDGL